MFKETLYQKVVDILNLNSQGLVFDNGYDIVVYQNIPYIIDQSSLNKFDFKRQEVIPVAEEYNAETPFFDPADRSDYTMQYQILFRLEQLDKVKIALEEYRAYFLANKQHIIDGYNVSFKVTRGEKQSSWTIDGGNYYGRYKINVYITSSKGYISKDSDKWEMREYGTVDYQELKLIDDILASNYNAQPSNTGDKMTHYNTTGTFNEKFRIAYAGTTLDKKIYQILGNKGSNNTLFNLRETFDGVTNEYVVQISSGARTRKINEPVFLEFDVVEYV